MYLVDIFVLNVLRGINVITAIVSTKYVYQTVTQSL